MVPVLALLGALAGYPFVQLIRMALSNVGPSNIIGNWGWAGTRNLSAELGSSALCAAGKTTVEFTESS